MASLQTAYRWGVGAIKTHPFNFVTLLIALFAAGFAGWSALEAHLTRKEADETAKELKKDIERSRVAAEKSAEAAAALADVSKNNLSVTERIARAAEGNMNVAQHQVNAALASIRVQQRPQLEITEYNLGESMLLLTLHNSGHSAAISPDAASKVELGHYINCKELDRCFVPDATINEGLHNSIPDIPVDDRPQMNMPVSLGLHRSISSLGQDSGIRVSGVVKYKDEEGYVYHLPFCYVMVNRASSPCYDSSAPSKKK
jgi:hypothetical protein